MAPPPTQPPAQLKSALRGPRNHDQDNLGFKKQVEWRDQQSGGREKPLADIRIFDKNAPIIPQHPSSSSGSETMSSGSSSDEESNTKKRQHSVEEEPKPSKRNKV